MTEQTKQDLPYIILTIITVAVGIAIVYGADQLLLINL